MDRPDAPSLPTDGFNALATTRNGLMLYNRNDEYIGASLRKYGEYSPGETELFQQILTPGMTVVEAGANIGVHTVDLSRFVGPQGVVVAFEPQRIVFQALCANLALNSCANVRALQAGLGEAPGEIVVPFLPPDQHLNFGGLSLLGANAGESVPLMTLDQLALTDLHFLKLDVEGMEVEALRGAARTIEAFRPLLYVENDRGDRSDELLGLLRSWNYRLYWHVTPLFSPNNFANDPENIFDTVASFNVLCVPNDRDITVIDMVEVGADGT